MYYYLDHRCRKILYIVLDAIDYVTLEQIAFTLNISKRIANDKLHQINKWLESEGLIRLEHIKGKGIFMDISQKEELVKILRDLPSMKNYIFSMIERVCLIIVYIIYSEEQPIYVEQLIDCCRVSRNTIFRDLKIVKEQLKEYGLDLVYSNHGYSILGDSCQIKIVFFLYYNIVYSLSINTDKEFMKTKKVEDNIKLLQQIENQLQIQYDEGILSSLALLLAMRYQWGSIICFSDLEKKEIYTAREYQLIELYFCKLDENTKMYLCRYLMRSKFSSVSKDCLKCSFNLFTYETARIILNQYEKIRCKIFNDKPRLALVLFARINILQYQHIYGIKVGNFSIDYNIMKNNQYMKIAKSVCRCIENQLNLFISDEEIDYLVADVEKYYKSITSFDENN
ncbi:MAG: helix-turn-helix domain-containing protein [Lachnospiraceae bacterium]|nr:helix-turn-helix domain-containing protein [Lachnospiraceae bacterium]